MTSAVTTYATYAKPVHIKSVQMIDVAELSGRPLTLMVVASPVRSAAAGEYAILALPQIDEEPTWEDAAWQ